MAMASKPVLLPISFSGDNTSCWDDWIVHFKNCVDVNGWDREVCLVGKAQSTFQQFKKDTFEHAMVALKERFKPSSKKDLYLAELSMRKRGLNENW